MADRHIDVSPGFVESRTRRWPIWRRFKRQRLGMAGVAGLILLYAIVLATPWIAPYGYSQIDLSTNNPAPSLSHPMGTQLLGQDELTRILYGGRVSLFLALVVAILATVVGAAVGLFSGFYGRALDTGLMGLADYAFTLPLIPVVMVAGFAFRFTPATMVLALTVLLWPRMARLVRAEALSVRGRDYIEAAKALGVRDIRILFRHLLPNVAGVVVVEATLTLAAALLTESALSYLAVSLCNVNGCYLPTAIDSGPQTLGRMLGQSTITMDTMWWLTVFPGMVIAVAVLCVSFLGDGLRDAFDPRAEERPRG